MSRRTALFSLSVALLIVLIVAWRRTAPAPGAGHDAAERARTDSRGDLEPAAPRSREPRDPARSFDGAAPVEVEVPMRAVRDRMLRDRIRERIFAMWSAAVPSTAAIPPSTARPDPLHAPMPERDGGGVDPNYLRERIREDFMPLAGVCYDNFLVRHPRSSGTLRVRFTILGDPSAGGVVDDAQIIDDMDAGPSFGDEDLRTCMRESLLTVAFRPPPRGGTLTVTYPFHMSPSSPDGA